MNKQKGFTIIEVIIAIFILTGAVIGVYSVFSTMGFLTSDATDRLTAIYLAQEGMEIIINLRADNWLYMDQYASGTWNQGFDKCLNAGCEVDYKTNHAADIKINTANPLLIDNTTGLYSYSSTNGKETKFMRIIYIRDIGNCMVEVESLVYWYSKANIINPLILNSVKIKESLYNWYNGYDCNII